MDSEYILTSDGQLYHWGIKGMKWGVRRYQNADGSLTAAGKKRYDSEKEKLKEREQVIKRHEKVKAKQEKLAAKKAELDAREEALKPKKKKTKAEEKAAAEATKKPKSIKDMTDEELRDYTTRMRLEREFYNAQKDLALANPRKVSAGEKFFNALKDDVVIPAMKTTGKAWLEKTMKDKLGLNETDPMKKLEVEAKKAELEYKKLENKAKIEKLKNKDPDDDLSWDERQKKQNWLKGRVEELENEKVLKEYMRTGKLPSDNKPNSNSNNNSNSSNNSPGNKSSNSSTSNNTNKSGTTAPKSSKKTWADEKRATQEDSYRVVTSFMNKVGSKNSADVYGTKAYEKRVDKILNDMDDRAWEYWNTEYRRDA